MTLVSRPMHQTKKLGMLRQKRNASLNRTPDLLQTRFVYFQTRKLAFAPLPDKIVCEPRPKTGVCALYKVENPSASPRGSTFYATRKSPLSLSVHNILH